MTWLIGVLAVAGCGTSVPTTSQQAPVFQLDSASVTCQDERVGVELAIEHAQAQPGYLDCITGALQVDPDGTIWLCSIVAGAGAPPCDGLRLRVQGLDAGMVDVIWHAAPEVRWSDPIQLLGRVRFG